MPARIKKLLRTRGPAQAGLRVTASFQGTASVQIADGLGQKAIAAELVISSKTVATHLQRILVKLGVHSRAEAVALAHREGLAQPRI